MTEPLDEVLDTAPCGFVSVAEDGCIRQVNLTLAQRLGHQRDDLIGRRFESILTLSTRLFYQTHFFPLVKMHGRAQEVFLMLLARTGETVGVLCNAVHRARDGIMGTD